MAEACVIAGLGLAGCAAIVYGVAQVSRPAGWMAFGCVCLFMALWPTLRARMFD